MIGVKGSAPGKAVLSGEYAVLNGAPAIAMALDRRAEVSIALSEREFHCVRSPGYATGDYQFSVNDNGCLQWCDEQVAERFSLLEHVWRHCAPCVDGRLDITIDTQSFFDADSGAKVGIGSSAAVACALTVALAKIGNECVDLSASAFAAHRDFQNKLGSGVDVATSLNGGVVEYRVDDRRHCEPIRWPQDICYQFFWSGNESATVNRIDYYRQAENSPVSMALATSAAEIVGTWRSGRGTDILDALSSYVKCLVRVSDEYELGIFAAGHAQMLALASDTGIVYKPCGAGGGDIGIALAVDEDNLVDFRDQSFALGFTPIGCRIDLQGAAVNFLS